MDQCAYRIIGGGLIKAQVRNSILTIGVVEIAAFFGHTRRRFANNVRFVLDGVSHVINPNRKR